MRLDPHRNTWDLDKTGQQLKVVQLLGWNFCLCDRTLSFWLDVYLHEKAIGLAMSVCLCVCYPIDLEFYFT